MVGTAVAVLAMAVVTAATVVMAAVVAMAATAMAASLRLPPAITGATLRSGLPFADARGSDRSRDREGVVARWINY
jgi:uncharacterized membrane protein YdfJ with MMPL/SSD domain